MPHVSMLDAATGEVLRERCGSCHNQEQHLERYDDVVFVHHKHVIITTFDEIDGDLFARRRIE